MNTITPKDASTSTPKDASTSVPVRSTGAILSDECQVIWGERPADSRSVSKKGSKTASKHKNQNSRTISSKASETEEDAAKIVAYQTFIGKRDQAALCLSGGGIRSASFALGVLQALAAKGLLDKFHYLSTVSGGGYIGAWLSRWINDHKDKDGRNDHNATGVSALLTTGGHSPNDPLPQIHMLRESSNFITPKVGLASIDFWTATVIWIRNILLNWVIFVPALFVAAGVFNLYLSLIRSGNECIKRNPTLWDGKFRHLLLNSDIWKRCPLDNAAITIYLLVGLAALAIAVFWTRRYLPSFLLSPNPEKAKADGAPADGRATGKRLIWSVAIPVLVFSLTMPLLLNIQVEPKSLVEFLFYTIWFVAFFASLVASYYLPTRDRKVVWVYSALYLIVSGILAGALAVAIWFVLKNIRDKTSGENSEVVLIALAVVGPLVVTWSQTMQAALYVGWTRRDFMADLDREWLARLSALRVLPPQVWMIGAFACLAVPAIFVALNKPGAVIDPGWANTATAIVSAISGLVAIFGGQSATVPLDTTATAAERRKASWKEIAINVATAIFVVTLLALLAHAEQRAAQSLAPKLIKFAEWLAGEMNTYAGFLSMQPTFRPVTDVLGLTGKHHLIVLAHFVILLPLVLFIVCVGRRINVNRFSLHGVYRNRLTRAFLGAARNKRGPDPFTGFDPKDNIRMHELKALGAEGRRVLFPVINVTMNLVRGDNLAWQERKAGPFVITPLVCGSGSLRPIDSKATRYLGAYISSDVYGGAESDLDHEGNGISLGTAITISGAAASPSMGYFSTPATAFLMTLFNVRLGAWLANPALGRESDIKSSGPRDALRALSAEMFGQTHDRGRNLYLSDGGHFDNLGLYEMLRRRCRFIVVVDAGADEDCKFEDLGNAVRKALIDLKVEVTFEKVDIMPRKNANALVASAIGRIRYPEAPKQADRGWILYLKPSYFTRSTPMDVEAFAQANSVFPHEATTDQWFSESQFESYRKLGQFLASQLGNPAKPHATYDSICSFFSELTKKKISPRML